MSCGCSTCSQQTDPLQLVRTGTHQVERSLAAPNAARLRVDERRPEHAMVFASAFSRHLPFVDPDGAVPDTWEELFTSDTSAQLAAAATDDVAVYRAAVQELLRRLQDPELPASGPDMIAALGAIFDCVGTLAMRLDTLKEQLPTGDPLRATMSNLIRSQLSPVLRQLIGFYLAGDSLGVVDRAAAAPDVLLILGREIETFDSLISGSGLSSDWPQGVGLVGWTEFIAVDLTEPAGAYGGVATDVARVNHLATHNLFTAACEAFLGGYARVVEDASAALRASFHERTHQPHYALFLAFLRLLDYARDEVNTITQRHLDFYYRQVLRLAERPPVPSQTHVRVELAKHVDSHLVEQGTMLKAGRDVQFALDRDLAANKATVAEIKSLYRHRNTSAAETLPFDDKRIFADPVANEGESWHPFASKHYADGQLRDIDMLPAEIGFAIASHHLWLAEGDRVIGLSIDPTTPLSAESPAPQPDDLRCRLTTAKGWLETAVAELSLSDKGVQVLLHVMPNDPAITPYDPAVHGYGFDTTQPVLLITLRHQQSEWAYPLLAEIRVGSMTLFTSVGGIKSLSLSNDQGPVDPSKPFLAFGSAPTKGSSLIIGSKEAFQKSPTNTTLRATFLADPKPYLTKPLVSVEYLNGGEWVPIPGTQPLNTTTYSLDTFTQPPVTAPDLTADVPYATSSRGGYLRLVLSDDFGLDAYPGDLANWVTHGPVEAKPVPPVLPVLSPLTLDYDTVQEINLAESSEAGGRFFHVTPFGHAEQHRGNAPLLPQFLARPNGPSDAELYIGVQGLVPPQNLALLFQAVDGTANPLAVKPQDHLRWSYLRGSEWVPFGTDDVNDLTDGLLGSGIVTVAVPADATTEHTLMPRGRHWIRVAVDSATDAVCRLLTVAAQAALATSRVPAGSATLTVDLPAGAITKLEVPDAAVKAVSQPYPTFGGRPAENDQVFATRVSERLRHKDRAIALWDYEHLVLDAFPGIYQARCLNHTLYGPTTCGVGDYNELAPGHVTVVTIPDLAIPNPRDPLRPYTSLRVLGEVKRYLEARMSCFAQLHVCNPQFEEVRVALRVRLRAGVDEAFHVTRLKQEITEFLSPWAYRSEARPAFNGTVHKSVLVNFVEERRYVDYVSDVQLFRRLPDAVMEEPFDETVVGSRAISILVSAPAVDHSVQAIPATAVALLEDCTCAPEVVS